MASAVGLGATSCVGGTRYSRPRALSDYLSWSQKEKKSFLLSKEMDQRDEAETLWKPSWLVVAKEGDSDDKDNLEVLQDIILTRLRTVEGLNLHWIELSFVQGAQTVEAIKLGANLAISLDLAEIYHTSGEGDYLRLLDPDGFLFSNSIISSIFLEIDKKTQ